MQKYHRKQMRSGGFSIIEMLVAVSLFVVVVTVIGGAFLGLVSSYRRVSSLRLNMDNLSASLDSIVRGIKTGKTYHCGAGGAITSPNDCPHGSSYLAFESSGGSATNPGDQVIYAIGPHGAQCSSANQICRSTDSGASWLAVTAPPPSMSINSLNFFVIGSSPADLVQPRVIIVIQGTSGIGDTASVLSVQTTITQKEPDTL